MIIEGLPGSLPKTCVLLLSGIVFLSPLFADEVERSRSPEVKWLADHAVEIRTIDAMDEDFSDLMPLKKLIGGARIVQLGEPSHGDGTIFEAKVRLVKFLHQEMGFDVLIWESGLYDCSKMNTAFRSGEPATAAASKGVFSLWSQCRQVQPLFEYAIRSHSTSTPLEMAGFDCQPTSPDSAAAWREDVVSLLKKLDVAEIDDESKEILASYVETTQKNGFVNKEARGRFVAAVNLLQTALAPATSSSRTVLSSRDADLWWHFLENAKTYVGMVAAQDEGQGQAAKIAMLAVREKSLEDTLVWQARDRYADRKIITWGAFGHFLHGSDSIQPSSPGFSPMGDGVFEKLGDEVYTVGFITYQGTGGRVGNRSFPLRAAPEGSYEALCYATDMEHLFVDLRSHKETASWLREERVCRANSYRPSTADWTGVCDAFCFTATMTPAVEVDGSIR